MKTARFIQFFDQNKRPILSREGMIPCKRQNWTPLYAISKLITTGRVPDSAVYYQQKLSILKSQINISPVVEIYTPVEVGTNTLEMNFKQQLLHARINGELSKQTYLTLYKSTFKK